MSDKLEVGGIPIRVVQLESTAGKIIMITPELYRALYLQLVIEGKLEGLPPGWDKERISENVVIIENVKAD